MIFSMVSVPFSIIDRIGYDIKEVEEEEEEVMEMDEQIKRAMSQTEQEIRANGDEHLVEDEELDYEVLSNLLTSLSLQDGPDGPMNSIMTSLGIHLPLGGGDNN